MKKKKKTNQKTTSLDLTPLGALIVCIVREEQMVVVKQATVWCMSHPVTSPSQSKYSINTTEGKSRGVNEGTSEPEGHKIVH